MSRSFVATPPMRPKESPISRLSTHAGFSIPRSVPRFEDWQWPHTGQSYTGLFAVATIGARWLGRSKTWKELQIKRKSNGDWLLTSYRRTQSRPPRHPRPARRTFRSGPRSSRSESEALCTHAFRRNSIAVAGGRMSRKVSKPSRPKHSFARQDGVPKAPLWAREGDERAAREWLFTAGGDLHKSPMNFRFLLAAGAAAVLAGCAVPNGQIRNGRFVSDDHGSLRITNQTVAFDLRDLPPSSLSFPKFAERFGNGCRRRNSVSVVGG